MFESRSNFFAAAAITVLAASVIVLPAVESRSIAVGRTYNRVNRRVRRPIRHLSIEAESSEDAAIDGSKEVIENSSSEEDEYDPEDIEAMEHLKTRELMRLLHLLESLRGGSLKVHQISGNDAAQLNFLLDQFGL